GMSAGSNRGRPISIRYRPSPSTSTGWVPDGLSTSKRSPRALPSRTSHAATQRAPLPHWIAALPSEFQIRYEATAPALRGGSMVRIWSQPTPLWRSPSARPSAASGGGVPSRRSCTTKSLPAPCILLKRNGGRGPAGIAQPPSSSPVAGGGGVSSMSSAGGGTATSVAGGCSGGVVSGRVSSTSIGTTGGGSATWVSGPLLPQAA